MRTFHRRINVLSIIEHFCKFCKRFYECCINRFCRNFVTLNAFDIIKRVVQIPQTIFCSFFALFFVRRITQRVCKFFKILCCNFPSVIVLIISTFQVFVSRIFTVTLTFNVCQILTNHNNFWASENTCCIECCIWNSSLW